MSTTQSLLRLLGEARKAMSQLRGLRLILCSILSCTEDGSNLQKDIAAAHRNVCDTSDSMERLLAELNASNIETMQSQSNPAADEVSPAVAPTLTIH